MQMLKAQIHSLRARMPAQRIILTLAEKSELLRIGGHPSITRRSGAVLFKQNDER